MIEFDVKIEAGDLYDYLLAHAYSGAPGILGSTFGALLIVFALMKGQWIFLILGAVLLVYLPWTLFIKSRQQVLNNPAFKKPLHYVLDEEGITVSQDGVTQKQMWADMYKAISTGRSIIVYTSRVNACIFPKRALGDDRVAVTAVISTHMPPSKVKIRN